MPHKPDLQDEGHSSDKTTSDSEDASASFNEVSRIEAPVTSLRDLTVLEKDLEKQRQDTLSSTRSEDSFDLRASTTELARKQKLTASLNVDIKQLDGDNERLDEELASGKVEETVEQVVGERRLSSFAGFQGPVPLSSLNSTFQNFVLRTVGNEVLREFRYRGVFTPEARIFAPEARAESGKMSAARQVSVSFDDVREKNLKQLRKLNQVLFPVRYEEKFYTDVLTSGEYTKLAYYSDICVGAIASKLEKRPEGGLRLYIMTLGVLAPYRRLGIASKLLKHCLDLCKDNPEVHEVYLHVQTSRDEAIAFYKKFGFEIVETLENYYKRIDPPHAYVLMKTLQPATGS